MTEKRIKSAKTSGGRSANKPVGLSDNLYLSGVKRTEIMAHLGAGDKKMAALIERAGPLLLTVDAMQSSYQALAESIVYQQITGKAAKAICQKIYTAYETTAFPAPQLLVEATMAELRACGLSSGKAMAIQDLAARTLSGLVPTVEEMHALDDEVLFDKLTAVRGIGPWTVHMLQIFRLGRLDVMPASDFGVRKGYANIYFARAKLKLDPKALPAPLEVIKQAEKWRPYRSAAAWYLWRASEGK